MIDEVWVALEVELRRLAPLAYRALHPGAEGAWVRALERRGTAADVIASHARHDGARVAGGVLAELPRPAAAPWTRSARWLSAQQAIAETERVGGHMQVAPDSLVIARVGRLEARHEDDPQMLVLVDGSGALYAAEEMLREYRPLECVALGVTWREALVSLTRTLASGGLVGGREDNVDRLVAVTPANDPSRAARRPRRPAESLLALLIEAQALSSTTVLDEAELERLDAALRKRSPVTRARDVLVALKGREVDPALTQATLAALLSAF